LFLASVLRAQALDVSLSAALRASGNNLNALCCSSYPLNCGVSAYCTCCACVINPN
ncbi:hypothetical protein BE221DRAFT_104722, partial [Ostreococcus tauri]